MEIEIRSDGTLERIGANAANAPSWMPRIVERGMIKLGGSVTGTMRAEVAQHRYTGALEQSIRAEYNAGQKLLRIGPTAKRGRWDAGVILEQGTRPIPRAPWSPIKAWAQFRGIPPFPVWYKIRTQGVSAHPFLARTLAASRPEIERTAGRIGELAARAVVSIGGVEREV